MQAEMEWLKDKHNVLKIDQIEKKLKLAQGTLSKFVRGERNLSPKVQAKLAKWVQDFQLKEESEPATPPKQKKAATKKKKGPL